MKTYSYEDMRACYENGFDDGHSEGYSKGYNEALDRDPWGWKQVSKEPPPIDEPVLFLFDSGGIIMDVIDKDMNMVQRDKFFWGTEEGGPITHWCRPKYPKGPKE